MTSQQQLLEATDQQINNVNRERNKELTSSWFEDLDVDKNNEDDNESLGFLDYHLTIDRKIVSPEIIIVNTSEIYHNNQDQDNVEVLIDSSAIENDLH